jgi:hypothetical protein
MLTCPMCKKEVVESARACPRCRTDLSILTTYLGELQTGIQRAESLTKAGELGDAVFAYLEVLEVDPDNAEARRQVGRVVSAVRQFDRVAEGRRWLHQLQRQVHLRRWLKSWKALLPDWWRVAQVLILLAMAISAGYLIGRHGSVQP